MCILSKACPILKILLGYKFPINTILDLLVDDQVRHSCNPNCYIHAVGKRAFLYSLYQIKANNELTFDYSTTSTDTLEDWKLDCKCNSYNCRKTISGMQYLDPKLLQEYKDKGMIPLFFIDHRFQNN